MKTPSRRHSPGVLNNHPRVPVVRFPVAGRRAHGRVPGAVPGVGPGGVVRRHPLDAAVRRRKGRLLVRLRPHYRGYARRFRGRRIGVVLLRGEQAALGARREGRVAGYPVGIGWRIVYWKI